MIFISHSYVTPLTLSSIHSLTFFSPTGCLLHHKNFSLPPHFLTTMTSFFHTLTDFFNSQGWLQHYQKHYKHIYSLSTCLFSLLNSNTNPGQDWSPDF